MMSEGRSKDRDCVSVAGQGVAQLSGAERDKSRAGEWMLKSEATPRIKVDDVAVKCVELDMGMGSRVEGFRICGHR